MSKPYWRIAPDREYELNDKHRECLQAAYLAPVPIPAEFVPEFEDLWGEWCFLCASFPGGRCESGFVALTQPGFNVMRRLSLLAPRARQPSYWKSKP